MRRLVPVLAVLAALSSASTAAASLQPIRRDFGELTLPRLRAGTIQVPHGHADGRVRVIVRLRQPPLAAVFAQRDKGAAGHRLDASSAFARAYVAKLRRAQDAAAAALRRAIPAARLSRRFQVLLNGMTVSLPSRDLPRLVRMRMVSRVLPSLTYTLNTNESPSVIGADALHRRTGALGDGVKIAVVDTGIDQTNPFLNADGMQYPPGFPRGGKRWTTPKVIVVRAFPGPGAGREGRIGGDPGFPHGTHVSGIAAGRAGTDAPPSADHPAVNDLSGVAPRAWLGAYRVFTVPTPLGEVANTPEIIAAFEAAVKDGMDVINFSGGGPQVDPANDAMIETVRNVAAAGVVPVISAGNDRDDFGFGTVGSPGVAPDAISVAAVTNKHVFTPTLTLDSPSLPGVPREIPFQKGAPAIPNSWAFDDQQLVDIGTIVGRDGRGVDRHLCGQPDDPNGSYNPLPAGSLAGSVALVSRGYCSFVSKAERAKEAGAIGLVLVNNRAGTPSPIPVEMAVPSGMISDLDGERLRNALASSLGRGQIRIDSTVKQIQTERSGIVTFFSSAGPTAFGHDLKPDVAAPGGDILSSVTKALDPSQFSVFDGTSMAAPHVTGAVALLVQLHPDWAPRQIKAALMDTAGAAWEDTARTKEAPVTLEGAGLIDVDRAADPLVFTNPSSISLNDLNANHGRVEKSQLVVVSDAGGGAGTWQVELDPQSATAGANVEVPSSVELSPGGDAAVPLIATATGGAAAGENYGFVVLRRGDATRRIPYFFLVTRPAFDGFHARKLKVWQEGTTRFGPSRVNVYSYPQWAFGPPPGYTAQPPMDEGGAEKLYTTLVKKPIANLGVAVIERSPNSLIDPFFLGSPDQNDVQGYAGTPVNVNGFMFDYHVDLGVAGAVFPKQQEFWVAVDSGSDAFTGQQLPGRYLLKMWKNDMTPPAIRLLTTRVSAGHPLLAARVLDSQSGVDPFSLVIGYRRVLVGAAAFDPISGLALFPLPSQAPAVKTGGTTGIIEASDNQEAKNVATVGRNPMPNTAFRAVRIHAVAGPAVSWLVPDAGACVKGLVRLGVTATSNVAVRAVRFSDGKRPIATVENGPGSLYVADWRASKAALGRHTLRATAVDAKGRSYTALRSLRVCK